MDTISVVSKADFDQLNQRITFTEILVCVKCLKREKTMDSDCVMNEYLIESTDILSSRVCDILMSF